MATNFYDQDLEEDFFDDTSTPVTLWIDNAGIFLGLGGVDGGAIPTTSTVVSSSNPSIFGASVTFTATVTPTSGGPPTGTVDFYDFGTFLGSILLDGAGQAVFSTSSLSVGTHSISVGYNTDFIYDSSTSSAVAQIVNTGAIAILMPAGCM